MTTASASPFSLVACALAAALYFSLSCTVTLEWVDEGQLVYQAWQVGQGAVPHRDFQHVYGPAVFLLNGLLLRLFGSDLLIIRVSLVVVKSLLSVLVYLAARRVASPSFAFVAFVSTVIVWGGPWWLFNTPYASHYAVALSLTGMLLYLRRGGRVGGLLAGVCCGLAATFKQTTGLFALASLVIFLSWDASTRPRLVTVPPSRVGQMLRLLAVLGSFAVCAGYLASGNTLWNVLVLFSPLALGIAWIAGGEVRRGAGAGAHNIDVMIAAGLGMAIPLALCVAGYAGMGVLGDLVAGTVRGLPQVIKWFFPVSAPDARSAMIALAVLTLLVGVFHLSRRRLLGTVALMIGLAVCALAALSVVSTEGIGSYVRQDAWIGDVYRLVFLIPFMTIWASLLALIPAHAPIASTEDDPAATRARVLLLLFAAAGLLALYPAADFWHLLMAWPLFAPILAWQLERMCRQPSGRVRAPGVAVVAALLLVCATPFVYAVAAARMSRPAQFETFARAPRITDGSQKFRDAWALVRYLDAQPADRRLLSFGEGQMLYFLAGRRSILEREEFALYLVGTGFVAAADARLLVPQAQAIARIERVQPIIIVVDNAPSTARLRDVFAEISAYIDAHYHTVATFGAYRVLVWGAA